MWNVTLHMDGGSASSMAPEQVLAARIQREREQRGWTYRGLANRVKGYPGCEKFPHNAIQKIERGERAVMVNELAALAGIFGRSPENLLTAIELLRTRRADRILEKIARNEEALFAALRERLEIACELTLANDRDSDPALIATVEAQLEHMVGVGDRDAPVKVDGRTVVLPPEVLYVVVKAMDHAMWASVREALSRADEGGPQNG